MGILLSLKLKFGPLCWELGGLPLCYQNLIFYTNTSVTWFYIKNIIPNEPFNPISQTLSQKLGQRYMKRSSTNLVSSQAVRYCQHILETSRSNNSDVTHNTKRRRGIKTITGQNGQRHVTGMPGSCPSRLNGEMLPSRFGIQSKQPHKGRRKIILHCIKQVKQVVLNN